MATDVLRISNSFQFDLSLLRWSRLIEDLFLVPKIVIALFPPRKFLNNYFSTTESTTIPRQWIAIHRRKNSSKRRRKKKGKSKVRPTHSDGSNCPTTSKLEFSAFAVTGVPFPSPPSPVSSCSRIIDHGDGSPPLNTIFWSPWRRLVRRREGLKHDSGWKGIRVKSRISPLWERGRGKAPDPRDGHVDGLKSVQLVWTYSVNVRPFWPEALSGKRERAPL